jgi:CRISPR-associated protein Cas2
MVLVVCYDVVSTKRRTRLFKKLKNYLMPVQKSVFEGELPSQRYEALRRDVLDTFDPEFDTVRIYRLCGRCRWATELLGTSRAVDPDLDPVM